MKIRTCMVSNSSSSSFLVKFPNIPTSKKELESFLDFDSVFNDWDDWYEKISKERILDIVWEDTLRIIKNREKLTAEQLKDFSIDDFEILLDSLGIEIKDLIDKPLIHYLKDDNSSFNYEYSDNDGKIWSAMEHCIAEKLFNRYLIKYESHH